MRTTIARLPPVAFLTLLAALAAGAPLAAQSGTPATDTTRAAPPVALRPSVQVRVELSHAARRGRLPTVRHGALEASGADSLALRLVRPTERRTFAWLDVVWVDTLTREHSLRRNMIIGAVFGGVAAGWFGYHVIRGLCERDCPGDAEAIVSSATMGAGLGAIGSLVFPRKREWARVHPR